MGRSAGILICILVVVMDVVAGILGLEAQVAQNKGKHLRVLIFECKEPVYKAYQLGLAAAILLAAAHAITNLLGGCICICSTDEFARSSSNKQMAVVTLLASWITLAIGFTMLMIGAMGNSKSRTSCGFAHRHLLSIGGILCFVHAVFATAYYAAATVAGATAWEGGRTVTRDVGTHAVA